MKKAQVILRVSALLVAVLLAVPRPGSAQEIRTTFVHLGRGIPGVLYEPSHPGPKAAIGVFVMHSDDDYLVASPCTELSRRGYRVFCANNSTSKLEPSTDFSLDQALLDAKLGVAYLRKYPGIRKVVLLGHSGGGALMAAYQNIAENGLKACQGPEKLIKCPDSLAGLPAADGVILLDSNFGLPGMMLLSLDPAVTNEASGKSLNPALDLFNPANGFNPNGSNYSEQFIRRWQQAVGQRNSRLVRTALDRMEAIESGKGLYDDDEPLTIPGANGGAFNNKLFAQDTRLLSHTKRAWPLLRKNGVIVTQIIHTVRVPENGHSFTSSFDRGSLQTTVRHFLNSYAVRVAPDFGYGEDGITGVDWSSNYGSPAASIRGVTVPLLTMGMTGHWEFPATELIYDNARSRDKSIAFVEGASHHFITCTQCEKTPGQFGDTLKTTFDYVDGWLSKPGRFLGAGAGRAQP